MISVRCPTCQKLVGFDEADGGLLVACPHCREPFFVPAVARPIDAVPVAAPPRATVAAVAPLPQAPSLPDEIRLADDPDLEPIPELLDEVVPADPADPPTPPDPETPPDPSPIMPRMELDPSPPAPELEPEPEPIGTPTIVQSTDLAPSLAAAEALSDALPPRQESDKPTDVLEEVEDEEDKNRRSRRRKEIEKDEEDERPRRRRSKKSTAEPRTPYYAQPARKLDLTRNRIMGGIGVLLGGFILLGTLAHHVTASAEAWHKAVCCGDLFALVLFGVGLYYLIKG